MRATKPARSTRGNDDDDDDDDDDEETTHTSASP
jgi:hypothetical protein